MPELLMLLSKPLTQTIIETMSWSASSQPLRLALEEDINQVPVLERSLFGVALAQGSAFSIYDALEHSQMFIDKHKPFWFANVQLAAKDLGVMSQSQMGRLRLSNS